MRPLNPNYLKSLRRHYLVARPCFSGSSVAQQSPMKSTYVSLSATTDEMRQTPWERKVTISQPSKTEPGKVLIFHVTVLDAFPDDTEQNHPTVVAVHGMPGSGKDFQALAHKLREKDIRLIAPTSLGLAGSPIDLKQMPEIDFSTKGRTQTLQLILTAMNVHRVDMLLGHSAGAWTLYEAGGHWPNVACLFCINPAGAEPSRPLRPFWLMKCIATMMYWTFFRKILMPLISFFYKRLGFRDETGNLLGDSMVAAMQYLTSQNFAQVHENAALIRMKEVPLIFAYALNDKIVEPAISSSMAHNVLGIPIQNTVMIGGDRTTSGNVCFVPEGWLSRCLVFVRGGHLVYLAQEPIIVDQIEDLLKLLAAKHGLTVAQQN